MKLTTSRLSTIAQGIIADMAAGSTNPNPVLEIYTGSIPSSMGVAITDTLLATLTLTATVATETDGAITFDDITADSAADAGGTPGWARVIDRDGNEALYLTAGLTGSGADIELGDSPISIGDPVAIRSGIITVGGE